MPNYGVGFAILAVDVNAYADVIGATLFPALKAAAREEVKAAYTGSYHTSSSEPNSSLTIDIDDERLGGCVGASVIRGGRLLGETRFSLA